MPEIIHEEAIRGAGKRPRLYGWLRTLDDGTKLYMARRKHREIFRSGKQSISGAMKEEIAAWAIDEDLLVRLRARGVAYVGVEVVDTNESYLAPIRSWFDPKLSKLKDYSGVGRGGSRQRYLLLQHMTHKRALVQLDENALYGV